MNYKEAKAIVESEFGDLQKEEKSQFNSIISLLMNNTFSDKDMKNARKDGIKFTLDIMRKHGTAKTFLYREEIIRQLNLQSTITNEEKKWLQDYIDGIIKSSRVQPEVMANEVVGGGRKEKTDLQLKILQYLRTEANIVDEEFMNAEPEHKDYWDGYVQAIRDIIFQIEKH